MYVQRHTVTLTTDASGDVTAYTNDIGQGGEIKQVKLTIGTLETTTDIIVSGESSGVIIWDEDNLNASATRAPRQASHLNTSGAAATYDGTRAVLVPVVVCNERIKVVVAQGGNAKSGTLDIWVG